MKRIPRKERHARYSTRAWRDTRLAQLVRQPLCELCKKDGRLTRANVVHHKIPHRGDEVLFLDPDNLESTCTECHNSWHQSKEKGSTKQAIALDGWPRDEEE